MNEQEAIETILYASAFNREDSPLTQSLDMAIEALKKQIPKKVVAGVRCKCPSCGELFASDWKFCFECGQKLDWTVEE